MDKSLKAILAFGIFCCVALCSLVIACAIVGTEKTESGLDVIESHSELIDIGNKGHNNHETLVYDSNTYIVYYYFKTQGTKYSGAYMCPYYSSNGNLCRYNIDTGKIEEIVKE